MLSFFSLALCSLLGEQEKKWRFNRLAKINAALFVEMQLTDKNTNFQNRVTGFFLFVHFGYTIISSKRNSRFYIRKKKKGFITNTLAVCQCHKCKIKICSNDAFNLSRQRKILQVELSLNLPDTYCSYFTECC